MKFLNPSILKFLNSSDWRVSWVTLTGIAPVDVPHLFETFYRAGSSRSQPYCFDS